MTKVLTRPLSVSDANHERVELAPGDTVPSWAEEYVDDAWCEGTEQEAAGTNLVDDNVYQVVKAYAEEHAVEYGESWDASQIAAAVRAAEYYDQVRADGLVDEDEVEEAADEGREAMAALFDSTNEGGNVNAPDQAAPAKTSRATKSSGTSGGAQSSAT